MPKRVERRPLLALALAAPLIARNARARADRRYDQGVSDTEIKLGTTSPYSGPASSFGAYGVAQAAYFAMLNEQGGINGRKVNLISLDDAYSPPKTIEQTRRLVEADGVLAIAGPLGTAPNSAIQKYLNGNKVPQLFLTSGGTRFNNPAVFPWSIPLYPSYDTIGRVFAANLLGTAPDTKIAVLFMNDDLGKDYLGGLRAGLGTRADSMIVERQSHELTDPVVDAQIVKMSESRAGTVFLLTTPRFAAQAIRKMAGMGWNPQRYVAPNAASIEATMRPAGLDKSAGIVTAAWEKHPDDPTWSSDPDMIAYLAFLKKYAPSANPADEATIPGYVNAYMIAQVLRACGDVLTRAEILRRATSLAGVTAPMLLPGIKLSNSPTDYTAFHQLQLTRFDGARWVRIGELIDLGEIGARTVDR
jgi:ABC-type branched-subunit amino acid transport system substrate-binding protein